MRTVDLICLKKVWKIYNSQILDKENDQRNPSEESYCCVDTSGFVGLSRKEKQKTIFFSPQLADILLNQKSFSFWKNPSVKCDWLFTFKFSQTSMK